MATRAQIWIPPGLPPGKHPVILATPREIEFLRLVREGYANKEIAAMLAVTPDHARNKIVRLFHRFGLCAARELIPFLNQPAIEPILDAVGIVWPHPAGCQCGIRWCRERAA
jgi:DNA-binding NarL/FixJ family response regulator